MSKPYRLPTLWSTIMAEGHGATIMANDRIGHDKDGRECVLAYHAKNASCERLGCYPVDPNNVRFVRREAALPASEVKPEEAK